MRTLITALSKAGGGHGYDENANQDFILSGERGSLFAIALADGVSSCEKAGIGAKIAGTSLLDFLLMEGESLFAHGETKYEAIHLIIEYVLSRIEREAKSYGRDATDYSSTLAGVLTDMEGGRMLFFNLGDGLILTTYEGRCSVLSMPGDSTHGCCVTTTKNASSEARMGIVSARNLDAVYIFSDGAWKKMFNRNRMKPEVKAIMSGLSEGNLREYLMSTDSFDDYSFISLNLKEAFRREEA